MTKEMPSKVKELEIGKLHFVTAIVKGENKKNLDVIGITSVS
jgi:hypothetical protein